MLLKSVSRNFNLIKNVLGRKIKILFIWPVYIMTTSKVDKESVEYNFVH